MKHPEFKQEDYANAESLYAAKAEYFERLVKGYEEDLGDPLGDIYIVVAERDIEDPMKSRGAIAFETHTGKANLPAAVDFGNRLGQRYGKILICKLQKVGDLSACEAAINLRY